LSQTRSTLRSTGRGEGGDDGVVNGRRDPDGAAVARHCAGEDVELIGPSTLDVEQEARLQRRASFFGTSNKGRKVGPTSQERRGSLFPS